MMLAVFSLGGTWKSTHCRVKPSSHSKDPCLQMQWFRGIPGTLSGGKH